MGNQPGEPTCCFCFPMKCGIILIGVSVFMDLGNDFVMIQKMKEISYLVMAFYIAAAILVSFAFALFLAYFCSDTPKTRNNLVIACALMIFANIISYTGIVLGSIIEDDIPFSSMLTFIPINGIQILIYYYFRMICKEWAMMGPFPSFSGGPS